MENFGANPIWTNANGKDSLLLSGLCHGSTDSHSVLFDVNDQRKCHCFSACGETFMWWNYIARALNIPSIEAKWKIEDYFRKEINWDKFEEDEHSNKNFIRETTSPINPMPTEAIAEIEEQSLGDINVLKRLTWATKENIEPNIMHQFNIRFDIKTGGILLPHHNILGQIIGIYLRDFAPLRKEIKKRYPDIPYSALIKYPRAKYVPLLKSEKWRDKKTSWSFQNSKNLYGLHYAAEHIRKTGKVIVFEGAKSCFLAYANGFPYAVATHTYGIGDYQINMLLDAGAKEIILAFDKQYETEEGKQYELYEHKTSRVANRIKNFTDVSRIISRNNEIGYKDAPIDKGIDIFKKLYQSRERLVSNGEIVSTQKVDTSILKIEKPVSFEDRIPARQNKIEKEDFNGYDVYII